MLAGRRKPIILPTTVLSPSISSLWCGLVMDVGTNIARPLVDGLRNETTCRGSAITELVPFSRMHFDAAVQRALVGVPLTY